MSATDAWRVTAVRVVCLPWEERRRRFQVEAQWKGSDAWIGTPIYRTTCPAAEQAADEYLKGPLVVGRPKP
jgi:hypothetical protein